MRKLSLKIWVGLLACVLISSQLVMPAQRAREVTLNEGTRITVRMNDTINTKTAHQGDRFSAEVISPVSHSGDVAIPTGSTIKGRVTQVKRPGRVKGKAELNLVPETIRLPNGVEESLVASISAVARGEKAHMKKNGEGTLEGEGSKKRDAAVIGAAGGIGAGIGAIAGGGKGAAIGGGSGALVGLAGVMMARGRDLELQRGTELDIVLDRPLTLPVR